MRRRDTQPSGLSTPPLRVVRWTRVVVPLVPSIIAVSSEGCVGTPKSPRHVPRETVLVVTGIATDRLTGSPLDSVSILGYDDQLACSQHIATSDSRGHYRCQLSLSEGSSKVPELTLWRRGYKAQTFTGQELLALRKGGQVTLSAALER